MWHHSHRWGVCLRLELCLDPMKRVVYPISTQMLKLLTRRLMQLQLSSESNFPVSRLLFSTSFNHFMTLLKILLLKVIHIDWSNYKYLNFLTKEKVTGLNLISKGVLMVVLFVYLLRFCRGYKRVLWNRYSGDHGLIMQSKICRYMQEREWVCVLGQFSSISSC